MGKQTLPVLQILFTSQFLHLICCLYLLILEPVFQLIFLYAFCMTLRLT